LRQRPRIEVGESTGLGLRGREVQRGRPHTQSLDGSDVVLQPSLWDDTFGNEAELTPLNQRAEAEGVAMTLRRVVASPVVPQAVVCFGPSDDGHRWAPWFDDDGSYPKVGSAPQKLGDGCRSLTMDRAGRRPRVGGGGEPRGHAHGPARSRANPRVPEDDPRPLDLRVRGARAVAGRTY
jgi:hypothetical protein